MTAESQKIVARNCRILVIEEDTEEGQWLCYEGVEPRQGERVMTNSSPFGSALSGRREGERIEVKLPIGIKTFLIKEIQSGE